MELKGILEIDLNGKNLLIIGCPASGKTWLSWLLKRDSHQLIHTDDYIFQGYEMGMYGALNATVCSVKNTIVEGVLGYRMLRKGAEYGNYYPDIVIEIKTPEHQAIKIYSKERDAKKIKYLQQFNSSHEKILSEYKKMVPQDLIPTWIEFYNEH